MMDTPLASQKRQALRLLGIAIAVSVVLSFPMEQVTHSTYAPGAYWLQNSCSSVESLLNLGHILQAILTPLFLFLLPGSGSILARAGTRSTSLRRPTAAVQSAALSTTVIALFLLILCPLMLLRGVWVLKNIHLDSATLVNSAVFFEIIVEVLIGALGTILAISLLRTHVSSQPVLYFVAGWLCAAAIPVAWWYGLRDYASHRAACQALFDSSRPVLPFQVDLLSDCSHYFKYLSGFSAVWLGVTAGGLRLQSARTADRNSSSNELLPLQTFFWIYLLGWALQYRLGQWLAVLSVRSNQEWITYSVLEFVYLTASSLWSLALVRFFWNLRLRTWWQNVAVAFAATFLICLLTALTFFWLLMWAAVALVPLSVLNLAGLAWALTVGTWRWRILQQEQAVEATAKLLRPHETRPNFTSLRAIEIVAAGIAGLLLLALGYAIYLWLFVYKGVPHH